MPRTRTAAQTTPLVLAGKWLAWSSDGRRIVAVGDSFEDVERLAIESGFAPDQIAIECAPTTRQRLTGSCL